jgi:predicted nucleotidyltransferase
MTGVFDFCFAKLDVSICHCRLRPSAPIIVLSPSELNAMTVLAEIDKDTERGARSFILKVIGQYDYAGAILFGSRARHTNRPDSDADIAVLLHGQPGKFVEVKLAMADIAYDVLLETGIRIQLLPIWDEGWAHPESYSSPLLLRNIEREGIRRRAASPRSH